jgi:hypothetical protein
VSYVVLINWIDLMRRGEIASADTLERFSTDALSELEEIFDAGIDAARQGLSALTNPFLLNGDSDRFNAWTEGYYAMLRAVDKPVSYPTRP